MKRRPVFNLQSVAQKLYGQPWGILPSEYNALHAKCRAGFKDPSSIMIEADEEESPSNDAQGIHRPMSALAVVAIHGVIGKHLSLFETLFFGGCDLVDVDRNLDAVAIDDSVGTVILDIRSPGGTCIGVPETCAKIEELATRKRVIAYADYMACSNGYRFAANASEFYAAPSAVIGNIGTIGGIVDVSKAYEMEGLKLELFVAGEYKSIGYEGTSLTDKQRAFLDEELQECDADFKANVLAHRRLDPAQMRGQWYPARKGLGMDFCDGLMDSLDDLLATLLTHDQLAAAGYG